MRFHLVAAFYVILFSLFYDFSKAELAVLLLTVNSVMGAEIFNTSLEVLCNLDIDSYNPLARHAKDLAAGAVLITSIAAAVIGFIFFFDTEVIGGIFAFFGANPILLALLILSFLLSAVFIGLGPVGIKALFYKHKNK